MGVLPPGVAGTGPDGGFYELPGWVDKKLQPGTTSQTAHVPTFGKWAWKTITWQNLIFSPNLVWVSIAAFVYYCFPYDIEAAKTFQWDWLLFRAAVNTAAVFLYFGWWHVTLYYARWANRKFNPAAYPSNERLFHNMWYCFLGAIQWTAWEAVMLKAYATGRMPYIADGEWFSTPGNALRCLLWLPGVPAWRDLHFYIAHRFIHYKPLYKYVHSLHHRNTDIEPFSGLSMHPIEHLYYYSCVWPCLYFLQSPFHFMWMGYHLLISPAASHSGWEDHFQSDQYHYLHHKFFECNYGTSANTFDQLFGTYREKMGESKMYKGEAKNYKGDAVLSDKMEYKRHNGFQLYMAISVLMFALVALAMTKDQLAGTGLEFLLPLSEFLCYHWMATASMLAYGPVLLGIVIMRATGDKGPLLWPFHKEPIVGGFGVHMLLGFIAVLLPTYHHILLLLGPESAYCSLWPQYGSCAGSYQ